MNTSNSRKTFTEEIKGTASEIISQVKKLVKEGNARRIVIKNKKGKTLFESQLTVGVGGMALVTAIAPIISAISLFVLFMNDIKVIVERYPGEEGDDYEIEADVIEIREEEEEDSDKKKENNEETKTDKTVGKKDEEE